MKSIVRPLVVLAATLPLLLGSAASAAPSGEAERLMKTRRAERYEVKMPHSSIKGGAARVHVKAPAQVVTNTVTDFGNYAKFIKKFEQARVVGKKGKRTDVYLQVPILKGAAKIWAIVRFDPPKTVNGEQIIEGHMLKGNVERLDAMWRIRAIDPNNTLLSLEMLIVPKLSLPLPGSLVTGEVASAADKAVKGSRKSAEKRAVSKTN